MMQTYSQFEHEKYEELCALATAGALTPQESDLLLAHLNVCPECSEIFSQYETLATAGIPSLDPAREITEAAGFDDRSALARLMQTVGGKKPQPVLLPARSVSWAEQPAWRGLIAASLLAGIAFASYRVGEHRRNFAAGTTVAAPSYAAQKQPLDETITSDNQRLAELEQQASSSKTEAENLRAEAKAAQDRLDALNATLATTKSQSDAQLAALTQDRDATAARLRDAQASYQTVQDELTNLRSQHQQDLLQFTSLEQKVGGLTAELNEQDKRANTDEQYLSSDKDIRDLIGARNLYIADIMDVTEDGSSRKPFGRVFYTKTKSLVFYAYDLDKQQGVKQASTFHVWGRTGLGDKNPINLGMLYMDSATNKRWTLRVDNPQQLAQLDAVFVTIEPHPQADRPTGKPFLVASLRREPNHP